MDSRDSVSRISGIIERRKDEWLEELARLVRQRSISASGEGVEDCAELFAEIMRASGIDAKVNRVHEGPGKPYPFVTGVALADEPESAPSMLVYGHYDVKPAGDLSEWDSDPFEPVIRDGRMYGRGVSDNKCQIFMYVKAVQICREELGSLPCTVKFIFEGGEEEGSEGLAEFLRSHREELSADFCLNSDGAMHESHRPTIKLGTKGYYAPILEITCANRDVHSMHGPTVPSAIWRMVEVLSSIRRFSDSYVLIDGFYDGVRPISEEEKAALSSMPNDGAVTLEELGLDHFAMGPHGDDYNYNFVFEPSSNINSIRGGFPGPGDNNVVAHYCRARLDFRLVPDQDPRDIHEKFMAHLHKHGFDDVKVDPGALGTLPVRIPVTNPYVQTIIGCLRDAYGKEPIVYPNGAGSGPLSMFTEAVGVQTAILPMCAADQHEHAPNENMRLDDFEDGIRACALMLLRLGK